MGYHGKGLIIKRRQKHLYIIISAPNTTYPYVLLGRKSQAIKTIHPIRLHLHRDIFIATGTRISSCPDEIHTRSGLTSYTRHLGGRS